MKIQERSVKELHLGQADGSLHHMETSFDRASEDRILTMRDVIARATQWDAEYTEMDSVPLDRFELTDDTLIFDKNRIPLDEQARRRLFEKTGAPVAYLIRRSLNLQMVALREHFQQSDFGGAPKLVLRNGQLFTIRRDNLVELAHVDVLNAVAESVGEAAGALNVSRIAYAGGRLELDLTSPSKALEVRSGDIVTAGLHVEHSRYGEEGMQIHAFNYRLVCENGMTRRECASEEGIVRIRKLPASHPRGRELVLDQVRRLTARVWQGLEPQLRALRASSERRVDVPQLLRQWVQRARFSPHTTPPDRARRVGPTVMDRLLAAWRDWGAEDTYYGAVNALTWVGSHDRELSPRQRHVLSLLGGLLAFSGVHICPRCNSVLSDPAQARDEHATEAA
jgi:hypothetical protein